MLDHGRGRVGLGGPSRLDLQQVPMVMWVTLEGGTDQGTGLVVNVRDIKQAVAHALEQAQPAQFSGVGVLDWAWGVIERKFSNCRLFQLRLELAERLSIARLGEDKNMVQITTKYELAAAHRLGRREWDGRKNEEAFGKCSNPAGHGHNYLLEVTLRGKLDAGSGEVADLAEVDAVVEQQVIQVFDHKNLNEDTEEFAELNPTVENMVRVFWDRLVGRFERGVLYRVAVWETPRTFAEYFGPGAGPLRGSEKV